MAVGTSKFDRTNPVTPDDSSTLPTAVNDVVGLLNGSLNADANGNNGGTNTQINLVSTAGFPSSGWVSIGAEIISFTGLSGNSLTGCVRGAQSTQIAAHTDRSPVFCNFTALHLNVLISCIIALQTMVANQKFDTGVTSGGTTITLTKTPITGKKVLLWINGTFFQDGIDFTWAGTVLTFVGPPYPPINMNYLAFYVGQ